MYLLMYTAFHFSKKNPNQQANSLHMRAITLGIEPYYNNELFIHGIADILCSLPKQETLTSCAFVSLVTGPGDEFG